MARDSEEYNKSRMKGHQIRTANPELSGDEVRDRVASSNRADRAEPKLADIAKAAGDDLTRDL